MPQIINTSYARLTILYKFVGANLKQIPQISLRVKPMENVVLFDLFIAHSSKVFLIFAMRDWHPHRAFGVIVSGPFFLQGQGLKTPFNF